MSKHWKIHLEDMYFRSNHGFYAEERIMGNDFILNVELYVRYKEHDTVDIYDTINYEDLYKICKDEMSITQKLLETVVDRIHKKIVASFPILVRGTITLKKQSPQLGGRIKNAAVSIEF